MRLLCTSLLSILPLIAACGSTGQTGPAPALQYDVQNLGVVDRGGNQHDIGTTLDRNKPVTLIFWQSWCAPCLQEAPALAAAARQWGERMLFLGVIPGPESAVDEDAVDAAVDKHGLNYGQIRDKDMALTKLFGVQGTPTILVLGKGGKVLFRGHETPTDWSAFLN